MRPGLDRGAQRLERPHVARALEADPALDAVNLAGAGLDDAQAAELAALLRVVLVSSLAGALDEAGKADGPVEARLSQACDLLLDGFRKRNERVTHARSSGSS